MLSCYASPAGLLLNASCCLSLCSKIYFPKYLFASLTDISQEERDNVESAINILSNYSMVFLKFYIDLEFFSNLLYSMKKASLRGGWWG